MAGFAHRLGLLVGLSTALTLGCSAFASAGFNIAGDGNNVRVQATDARINDVLTALHDKYGLIYHNDVALDQTITGNYAGSLDRVVKQIMQRYDHAIKTRDGVVELVVTNQVKSTAKPPPLTPPSTPGNVSAVTTALQMQANQIATMNSQGNSSQAPATGASGPSSSSSVIGAGAGSSGGSASGGSPAGSPATSSMAELTQRASSTVRELTQALSRVTQQ